LRIDCRTAVLQTAHLQKVFNTLMLERDLALVTKLENFTLPDVRRAQQSFDKLKAKLKKD
jgi:hypothetical protein